MAEERLIRIGTVSSVNYEEGSVRVTYPDLDNSVTDSLPVLNYCGRYRMPEVGEDVLVLHLSNGTQEGFVIGPYFSDDDKPEYSGKDVFHQEYKKGTAYMLFKDGQLLIKAPQIVLQTNINTYTF